MKKVQIIYPANNMNSTIHPHFLDEAKCMHSRGFMIGIQKNNEATKFIYRGFTNLVDSAYGNHNEDDWVNTLHSFHKTLQMSRFINVIQPWTFPSKVVDQLEQSGLDKIRNEWGGSQLFIKNNETSLFFLSDSASVYPNTDIKKIQENFSRFKLDGPYIVRKFIEDQEIFYNEQRVWVLNGNVYFTADTMPDFIYEVARRVYEFSGSKYFVIDVAGNYVVEVNPGESSDRGGMNSLEWFCDIFAKEFLVQ